VIGAVGRLSAEKGFDLLIRATDQLLQQNLDVELLIIGEGDDEIRLQALIKELGRADRCRLMGYQAELRPFYEAMDVFALSSLREGLPNVLLEAMAMEVPVVSTAVAGIPRLIQHGHNGLLVPPGAAVPLIDAVAKVLRDPRLRRQIGVTGRHTVTTQYSFEQRIGRLSALYDEILQRQ
jgi:glycosyltransferase involved in cell wall biosynthesis